MSDNDKAVPPWLRPVQVPSGGPGFARLSQEAEDVLTDAMHIKDFALIEARMPVEEWEAWRRRLGRALGFVEPVHDWLQLVRDGTQVGCYRHPWQLMKHDGKVYRSSFEDSAWRETDDPEDLRVFAQMTHADFSEMELRFFGEMMAAADKHPALAAWDKARRDKAAAEELRKCANGLANVVMVNRLLPGAMPNAELTLEAVAADLLAQADEIDPPTGE